MLTTRRRSSDFSHRFILFRYCGLCISLIQLLCFTDICFADIPTSESSGTTTVNITTNTELSPYWDDTTQSIYFVTQDPGKIRRYDPKTYSYYSATLRMTEVTSNFTLQNESSHNVSFVIPVQGQANKFAVGLGVNVAVIEWDGKSDNATTTKLILQVGDLITAGTSDANGILYFVGIEISTENVGENQFGTLYSVTSGGGVYGTQRLLGLRNGIAFNSNSTQFYYTDATSNAIRGLNYNSKDLIFTEDREVFDFTKQSLSGIPRGLTVDSDGNVWVACTHSENIYGINPTTGELLQTIPLPAIETMKPSVTSVVFAGPNLDELYATTDTDTITPDAQPPLLRVTGFNGAVTGVPGVPVLMPNSAASTPPSLGI